MSYSLLNNIQSPQDIKEMTSADLVSLCQEIRSFLIESVSKTGGHLSSNLGAIELTVAFHHAFETPKDKILFDVGHQCYTHKLLTGRMSGFSKLRQLDGLSGFPCPAESSHDAFVAGHGNTAISAAVGIAQAKKIKNEPGKVVALVGDGAFTGGMVYEGMNNIGTLDNLIVILNDNKMSISKNVGALPSYLTQLRSDPAYSNVKAKTETILDAIPLVGKPTVALLQGGKRMLRRTLYHSTMFEEMGFQYLGPVDGHDVLALCELLGNVAQKQTAPVFLHAVTVKGKGFAPAEENPGEFHGVSAFNPTHAIDPEISPDASFSVQFGHTLVEFAKQNRSICAITAAMKYGTGLQYFYRRFPDRFFDVGMAEQHAVTFAAGLASEGLTPVVAVYSTFLQRSYDQIINDTMLMNLNVVFAIDRAGLVPGDGETHQGIYDVGYLSQIGMPVYSPCNYAELNYWLEQLVQTKAGPRAIRYPRGAECEALAALGCSKKTFDCYAYGSNAKVALVTYGSLTEEVLHAAEQLQATQACDVYKLVQIYPLSDALCEALQSYNTVLFAEDAIATGGIGEHLNTALSARGWHGHFVHCAIEAGTPLPFATVPEMRKRLSLDADAILLQLKGEQE